LHNAQLFRNLGIRRADNRKICEFLPRFGHARDMQNFCASHSVLCKCQTL
jgi:hypothetical protein